MRILFVEPNDHTLLSFRKELIDELIKDNDVFLCLQNSKEASIIYNSKVSHIFEISTNLKSKSIFQNVALKRKYKKIIADVKPDIILSFSVKPNVYCGILSKKVPMIANVTGLGQIFKKPGILAQIGLFLYKAASKNIDCFFFQNRDSYEFFLNNKIRLKEYQIIPGSGVNLGRFVPKNKKDGEVVSFLFASRAIKEKGFNLLLDAIPLVLKENKKVHFTFLTAEEDVSTNESFMALSKKYSEYITLLPRINDMENIYPEYDFLLAPSFYKEGISNVLLESLSCGTPIITTFDNSGCKEVLQEGINGYGVKSNDLNSLVGAILKASHTTKDEIIKMGQNGRRFVEDNFDRNKVIEIYKEYMSKLTK